MIPPVSPYSLIQESLWPAEWLIIVSCMMLNRTSRKQVDKVLPAFIKRWPTPQAFMSADTSELESLIRPLGFASRRATALKKMTKRYLCAPWDHAKELPGVGEYAARAWEIFCRQELGDSPPKDHALTQYYCWLVAQRSKKCLIESR